MESYRVNVSEFRNRRGFYIREAKRGCKVILCDRGVPFAKLIAIDEGAKESDNEPSSE